MNFLKKTNVLILAILVIFALVFNFRSNYNHKAQEIISKQSSIVNLSELEWNVGRINGVPNAQEIFSLVQKYVSNKPVLLAKWFPNQLQVKPDSISANGCILIKNNLSTNYDNSEMKIYWTTKQIVDLSTSDASLNKQYIFPTSMTQENVSSYLSQNYTLNQITFDSFKEVFSDVLYVVKISAIIGSNLYSGWTNISFLKSGTALSSLIKHTALGYLKPYVEGSDSSNPTIQTIRNAILESNPNASGDANLLNSLSIDTTYNATDFTAGIKKTNIYERSIRIISSATDIFGSSSESRSITVSGISSAVGKILWKSVDIPDDWQTTVENTVENSKSGNRSVTLINNKDWFYNLDNDKEGKRCTAVAGMSMTLTSLVFNMTHGTASRLTSILNLSNLYVPNCKVFNAASVGFSKVNFGNHKNYNHQMFENNSSANVTNKTSVDNKTVPGIYFFYNFTASGRVASATKPNANVAGIAVTDLYFSSFDNDEQPFYLNNAFYDGGDNKQQWLCWTANWFSSTSVPMNLHVPKNSRLTLKYFKGCRDNEQDDNDEKMTAVVTEDYDSVVL